MLYISYLNTAWCIAAFISCYHEYLTLMVVVLDVFNRVPGLFSQKERDQSCLLLYIINTVVIDSHSRSYVLFVYFMVTK